MRERERKREWGGREMEGRRGTQGASFYRISIQRITAETPNALLSFTIFVAARCVQGRYDAWRFYLSGARRVY